MLTATQEDHEAFKALNNRRPDIKKAVTALAGKKKGLRMLKWIRMVTSGLRTLWEPQPRSGKFEYYLLMPDAMCGQKLGKIEP